MQPPNERLLQYIMESNILSRFPLLSKHFLLRLLLTGCYALGGAKIPACLSSDINTGMETDYREAEVEKWFPGNEALQSLLIVHN